MIINNNKNNNNNNNKIIQLFSEQLGDWSVRALFPNSRDYYEQSENHPSLY